LSDRHFLVQPQTVDRPGIGDIAACLGSLASGDLLKRRHDVVAQSDPARSAPQVGDVRSDAYTVGSPHPPLEGQVDFAATASTWRVNPRCFILKLRLQLAVLISRPACGEQVHVRVRCAKAFE
jgi:hypothetical protein